jgi:hypothetical protein
MRAPKQNLTSAQKVVGYAIADHYNRSDGFAWPSVNKLARWADLDRKTVTTAVRALTVDTDWFIKDSSGGRRRPNNGPRSNWYIPNFTKADAFLASLKEQNENADRGKNGPPDRGKNGPPDRGRNGPLSSLTNPVKEPSRGRARAASPGGSADAPPRLKEGAFRKEGADGDGGALEGNTEPNPEAQVPKDQVDKIVAGAVSDLKWGYGRLVAGTEDPLREKVTRLRLHLQHLVGKEEFIRLSGHVRGPLSAQAKTLEGLIAEGEVDDDILNIPKFLDRQEGAA